MKATSNVVFQEDDPLHFCISSCDCTNVSGGGSDSGACHLYRTLRQPRVIAEIIARGVLLGPSALGRNQKYLDAIFPPRSLIVLDTLANLGLMFFLFLIGLELDPKGLRRTGKKALTISLGGIGLPFSLGVEASFLLRATIPKGVSQGPFLVFHGIDPLYHCFSRLGLYTG
ncbi:Cation/H(+) antiporter 18 [Sesamum alatum]|uniref:Cation/H(+) antiporter 18 n=1 Tax=Sesamum alatum TaxID=300844 RepID=A0AAE1Y2S8_9LAMI|nr:Cation/H(+) antiporter 18 [Sesamum alatum]